jgi:elongation factor 1-beta
MSPNHTARNGGNEVSLPRVWRNNYLALFKVPKIRKALPLSKMRLHRTLEEKPMAKVLVSLKIFPSDVSVNLIILKRKIEESLPEYASIHKFTEEPIAFGLIALIADIIVPEDKSGVLDEIERLLKRIEGINELETLMVRRV